jgi:hypothetical protein
VGSSPLTSSTRSAVDPVNAMLNLGYALAEAEARVALLAVGLDPDVAVLHADVRGRASLALDVLEAVRPAVDAYVLALVRERVFSSRDFHETRQGGCRILPPLTHELAETLPRWGELVAPVAERVAAMLATAPGSGVDRLPTPLTSANRRAARDAVRRRPPARAKAPKPNPPCRRCGGEVPHRDRTYCDACAALPQSERYASTLGLEPATSRQVSAGSEPGDPPTGARTNRRCKRCGGPVSHRKRVLCDACFIAFRQELAAQRRPCKRCGEPVPHRKRVLCDRCLASRST